MSAIATKNSNAAFNRIFVAGVGVIVVAGVGAVVGHDVLDGLHVDRDCRPNIELCAAPVAVIRGPTSTVAAGLIAYIKS
jgi:hypothetical protein